MHAKGEITTNTTLSWGTIGNFAVKFSLRSDIISPVIHAVLLEIHVKRKASILSFLKARVRVDFPYH